MTRLIQASALLGLLGCAAAPSPLPASRDACVVTTEVVNGFHVTVVRPASPMVARRRSRARFVSAPVRAGSFVPSSQRILDTVRSLMTDPYLGDFVQEMSEDPEITYYLFDSKLRSNGGGKTTHCNPQRFDIWMDPEFHISREGTRCKNPSGSGSLRSLLAHELGHAWAWRYYGDFDPCDNEALGNVTAVAWESSQLAGAAVRQVHNPPGCGCGY